MENKSQAWQGNGAMCDGVSRHLAKIEELKESLRYARGINEEMRLLSDLTEEISTLRQLNEPHYQ